MRFALLVTLASSLAACNGKSDKTTPAQPDPVDAGAATDATLATVTADAGPTRLSRDECQKFIDHVLSIVRAEHNRKVDPSVRPSDQQVTKIRTKLRDEDIKFCMRLPRAVYRCALRAKTRDDYLACQPKPAKPAPDAGAS